MYESDLNINEVIQMWDSVCLKRDRIKVVMATYLYEDKLIFNAVMGA